MLDYESFRSILEGELVLIEEASELSLEARAVVQLDQNTQGRLSRMDAMERQAMAEAAERRRVLRVSQIKAALKRIDEGEFGYCQECGEDIEPARLQAEPCVLKCLQCACV